MPLPVDTVDNVDEEMLTCSPQVTSLPHSHCFSGQVDSSWETIEIVPEFFAGSHVNSSLTVEPSTVHLRNEKCISFTTQMY